MPTKLILLPGLDGTGRLFKPLLAHLPESCDVTTIRLPMTGSQTYPVLQKYVEEQLSNDSANYLVVESFSGPLGFAIATNVKNNIRGVAFVASFLCNPRPLLLRFRQFIPINIRIPDVLIKHFFLGKLASHELISEFWNSLAEVEEMTLRQRLDTIANLSVMPSQLLPCPSIYLQPTDDLLVPKRSLENFRQACPDIEVHRIVGTHFLLQSAPKECATIIKNEIERIAAFGSII